MSHLKPRIDSYRKLTVSSPYLVQFENPALRLSHWQILSPSVCCSITLWWMILCEQFQMADWSSKARIQFPLDTTVREVTDNLVLSHSMIQIMATVCIITANRLWSKIFYCTWCFCLLCWLHCHTLSLYSVWTHSPNISM